MPIKVHHGAPGSYKTAGAMADDFLREAKAGRVIVTNVRGVSRERTLEEFPDLPESFDVIHVDDKTEEGRKKWATWFHWVPHGAFLFIDEVQDIWPKSWRDTHLRTLDYPGGVEAATADDRPKDWEQAFDKHRHYNWDMTLTTPSYAKVRSDVKDIADMAYKHKNLALVGWTGRYIEGAHAADDTGKNASDFVNVVNKKVPSYVFKLYDSTQTGQITDTKSGINLLKNPRVLMLLGIVALCLLWVLRNPLPAFLGGSSKTTLESGISAHQTGSASDKTSNIKGGGLVPASANTIDYSQDVRSEPFIEAEAYILMSYRKGAKYTYAVRYAGADFTSTDLLDMGYAIEHHGSCALVLIKDNFRRVITCALPEKTLATERAAERTEPVASVSTPSISIPPAQVHKPF